MLTHHDTVSSITIPARLSQHEQRPVSHPAHARSSSSNAAKAENARLSEALREMAVRLTLVEGKGRWGSFLVLIGVEGIWAPAVVSTVKVCLRCRDAPVA